MMEQQDFFSVLVEMAEGDGRSEMPEADVVIPAAPEVALEGAPEAECVGPDFAVDLSSYQGGMAGQQHHDQHPHKLVMRAVEALAAVEGWGRAWSRLLGIWWATLARLSDEDAEARYMSLIGGLSREVLEACAAGLGGLIRHFHHGGAYCDILGPVHMEVTSRWAQSGTGQFFTPWAVCVMMARQAGVPDEPLHPDGRPWAIHDPAIGSGACLLAYRGVFAEKHGRLAAGALGLYGQDIDEKCVLMSKIQMRLTCPQAMTVLLETMHLPPAQARQVLRVM